jgi:predicted DsbA family dithiol-disulfide isomerase
VRVNASAKVTPAVVVEVWSDVACPWCLIGKRRFDRAVGEFDHAGDVEVVWRSFQLDPTLDRDAREPEYEHLAKKLGRSVTEARAMTDHVKAIARGEGLEYDFDRAVSTNTFDAHRIAHLGAAHGLGSEMHERLLIARLVEGQVLNDAEVLTRLALEVGLAAEEAREVLASDRYADDVRRDIALAGELGLSGVPFFVLNRTYGISGAQPVGTFLAALTAASEKANSEEAHG